MKKYSSYKDSGVEWIGEIPEHWKVSSLKNAAKILPSNVDKHIFENEIAVRLCNYTDVYYNEFVNNDSNLSKGSCTESEYEKFLLTGGEVIITKDSESADDIGIPAYISNDVRNVVCGYHLTLMRCKDGLNGSYLFRFIQSNGTRKYFEVNSNGITRYGLGKASIENLKVPIPPLPEQQAIVTYLDEKTTLIDDLIKKKQEKIQLLKENRTALINHVVTKGLDPEVEMKDSGVEWIGEVPVHWSVSKFKYDSAIPVKYGLNISSEKYQEEGVRFIRITDITPEGELIEENGKYLSEDEIPLDFLLNKYDLLFCRSGHTVGKSYLHLIDGQYSSAGYLVRFNFKNYSEAKFVFYISETDFYWDWIKLNSVVSTIENVNGEKYSNFQYVKPPISEQQQIVTYLDEQTQLIDQTIQQEEQKIELLKEYRQSLISEVVTGKICVV